MGPTLRLVLVLLAIRTGLVLLVWVLYTLACEIRMPFPMVHTLRPPHVLLALLHPLPLQVFFCQRHFGAMMVALLFYRFLLVTHDLALSLFWGLGWGPSAWCVLLPTCVQWISRVEYRGILIGLLLVVLDRCSPFRHVSILMHKT